MVRLISMYRISQLFIWLRRMHHSRGFGIQSPNDYGFIRYVVNEHYPYYAYADLEKELPDISRRQRKLCRLYFRMANYCQAHTIVDCSPTCEAYRRYFQAGCHRSRIQDAVTAVSHIELLRVAVDACDQTMVSRVLDRVDERSVVLVEGIRRSKKAKAVWKAIYGHEKVGVSFDLHDVGILFFDPKRYKQHYIINF